MIQNINAIETKAQLHYRYLYLILGCVGLFVAMVISFFAYIGQGPGSLIYVFIWIVAFIAFFVYLLMIVKKLTKKVIFDFEEKLTVQIFDIKTGTLQESYEFVYSDIKSFFLSSGSAKTCTIKLNFFERKSFKLVLYSAEGNFSSAEKSDGFAIFKRLCMINPKIDAYKPFFITKAGNIAIIFLLTLFVINILIHIKFGTAQSLMISLPTTLVLLIMVLTTRKTQRSLYEKMKLF